MRTAPKYLFELSAREARQLALVVSAREPNLLGRLRQFMEDADGIPLTVEELTKIGDECGDPKDLDFVVFNLPPGQIRREYLNYMNEAGG